LLLLEDLSAPGFRPPGVAERTAAPSSPGERTHEYVSPVSAGTNAAIGGHGGAA
jgi:hypothetical protein